MIITKIANGIETNLYGRKGISKPLHAVMSNTLETFINDKNEKIITLYNKGKLRQAHKYSADGDVVYIKKYSWDENNHTVEILNIDDKLNVSVQSILKRTNDAIIRYAGKYERIDKYFRKFAHGWKRLC